MIILKRLCLIFFGVVLSLALVEGLVRVYPGSQAVTHYSEARPLFYFRQAGTSSFKNYSFSEKKPENVYRIATIGDSFTYPHYMQLDYAYPKVLERMLNLNYPHSTKLKTEVINYGTAGYSTMDEMEVAKVAIAHGADLIIMQITLNDPVNDHTLREMSKRTKNHCSFDKVRIDQDHHPLFYYWKTAGLIARRLNHSERHSCTIDYYNSLFEKNNSWNNFTGSILSIKKIAAERKVPVVAVVFPLFNFRIDKHYPFAHIHDKIDHFLRKSGIKTLDLRGVYKKIEPVILQVIPHEDSHPNEIAHRLAAERIYLWLENFRLIPEELIISEKYARRFPPVHFAGTGLKQLNLLKHRVSKQLNHHHYVKHRNASNTVAMH